MIACLMLFIVLSCRSERTPKINTMLLSSDGEVFLDLVPHQPSELR